MCYLDAILHENDVLYEHGLIFLLKATSITLDFLLNLVLCDVQLCCQLALVLEQLPHNVYVSLTWIELKIHWN